ncbi:hypothetical protein Naga_100481g1, partial [Nannochloropsis gaditana]
SLPPSLTSPLLPPTPPLLPPPGGPRRFLRPASHALPHQPRRPPPGGKTLAIGGWRRRAVPRAWILHPPRIQHRRRQGRGALPPVPPGIGHSLPPSLPPSLLPSLPLSIPASRLFLHVLGGLWWGFRAVAVSSSSISENFYMSVSLLGFCCHLWTRVALKCTCPHIGERRDCRGIKREGKEEGKAMSGMIQT